MKTPIDMKNVKVMVLTFRLGSESDIPTGIRTREERPQGQRSGTDDGSQNRLVDAQPEIGIADLLADMQAGAWGIADAFVIEREPDGPNRRSKVYLLRLVLRPVADIPALTPDRPSFDHLMTGTLDYLARYSMWTMTVHRNGYRNEGQVVPGAFALSVSCIARVMTAQWFDGKWHPELRWVRKEGKHPVKEEGKRPLVPRWEMRLVNEALTFEPVPLPEVVHVEPKVTDAA